MLGKPLFSTTILDVLRYYGKDTRMSRAHMIRSPFREELIPSVHITPRTLRGFIDYGDPEKKGSVVDMIRFLEGCSQEKAVRILNEEIEGKYHSGEFTKTIEKYRSYAACSSDSIEILSIEPIEDRLSNSLSKTMIAYARSRGIRTNVFTRYCSLAKTQIKGRYYEDFFIAFKNSIGAYELRKSRDPLDENDKKFLKRCTGKYPTFLSKQGRLIMDDPDNEIYTTPTSDKIVVFEGFFDFLSFCSLYGDSAGKLNIDACILNGVGCIESALPFIMLHKNVSLYLDHDQAGNTTKDKIASACKSNNIHIDVDADSFYKDFNDINDFLKASQIQQHKRKLR